MTDPVKKNILVAVTGASGALYAQVLLGKLEGLKGQCGLTGVIFSDTARKVWGYELENDRYKHLPFTVYPNNDLFAAPASGSAGFDTMIICPCSMGTLGRIAAGTADNLLLRAADVILKERRRLILVIREAPLSLIHIRNMETLTLSGAMIFPASPGLYCKTQNLTEIAGHFIDRVLESSGFILPGSYRWGQQD